MDAQHVGDLATAILSLAAWQALVVRMAQTGDQVPAQLTHGLGVDAVVDGLVRHAVLMPFGIQASERQGFSLAHSGTQSITGHRDDIFFAAIETARMPILVTDPRLPDNPIVFVNRAFISMTGYSVQEVMGQNCRFLQGPGTDPSSVAAIRAAIDDRHEISLELLNYRKDGTSFWNALYISPIFGQHKELVYFFASQLDVTRRRNAETALGHAQKMEALGQLTGAIAHDFNNLLQVMSGHVELLEVRRKAGSVTDAALERDLIDVRSAIGKTSTLTQQLLAFSREQRLEGRLANLNTLVGELTAW